MNNKSKLLIASILACVTAGATLAVVGMNKGFENLKASKASKTHTVTFQLSDFSRGEYDADLYGYPLFFNAKDVIDDIDDNKYDVNSVPFYWKSEISARGTYIFCSDGDVTFKDGSFMSFTNDNSQFLNIEFKILKRANVDLDKSIVGYTYDGTYDNEKFEFQEDFDEEYSIYSVGFGWYSHYGAEINITEVKLVFSCDR